MHIDPRIRRFFNPVVRNAREYRLFVAKITLGAVFAALSFDVANQLLFAHTWEDAISSWIVTIAMAASISLVASIVIGQAYLELFEAKSAVDVLSAPMPSPAFPIAAPSSRPPPTSLRP